MRFFIGIASTILIILGLLFTSYANIDSGKIISPKPDKQITYIEDSSNDEIKNNVVKSEASTPSNLDENYKPSENKPSSKLKDIKVPEYIETEQKESRLFLIMGTDVVYNYRNKVNSTRGRTDAILLAKMTNEGIDLISIPRDSYVNIPDYGYNKINSANVKGGPELLKKTVENWLNLKIDDYVLINTFGVIEFVDLFGGIDFNVPKRMKYNDYAGNLFIDLYPGMQKLDGKKVHDLLRFRNDELGDLNRVKREQDMIKAILTQTLKPSNLLKIPSALYILDNYIETSMNSSKVVFLAKKLLETDDLKNKISMQTLPGIGGTKNGAWYWFIDEKETKNILSELNISNDINITNKTEQ
ncbi:MAG: LCP family protein [Candidatus Sericytochromatia bacterium]